MSNVVALLGVSFEQHQIVWGRGRDEGADVWMTVAHSSNCQVLSTAGAQYIQLRVVVQNLRAQPLTVDLQELEVRMKGGSQGTIFGVGPVANQPRLEAADAARVKQLAPAVLAVNGVDVHPSLTSQLVELQMFEFAVLAVNVVCNGCEFEPDFLESCSSLWVPIRRVGRCTSLSTCRCGLIPDSYHRGIIRVPVVDESVIWRHYDLVSNRFMVRPGLDILRWYGELSADYVVCCLLLFCAGAGYPVSRRRRPVQ